VSSQKINAKILRGLLCPTPNLQSSSLPRGSTTGYGTPGMLLLNYYSVYGINCTCTLFGMSDTGHGTTWV